jgi:cob(I)alamin adenosyltransferase
MVFLSRIYTKSGDAGETGLGDGSRVPKDAARVAAYGEVDELNSVLGLVVANCPNCPEAALLRDIQNDLFDVGADLCVPQTPPAGAAGCAGTTGEASAEGTEEVSKALRVVAAQYERLEKAIDRLNEGLQPLRSFILPGGTPAAAWLHLARTVCRRAERAVVKLTHDEKVNTHALIYLNRLSDFLFVLARVANDGGKNDVLWVPGASRGAGS